MYHLDKDKEERIRDQLGLEEGEELVSDTTHDRLTAAQRAAEDDGDTPEWQKKAKAMDMLDEPWPEGPKGMEDDLG